MILSHRLASSATFFAALAVWPAVTFSQEMARPKGLSLSDYDSILFTDVKKEFVTPDNVISEKMWSDATEIEWERSEKQEMMHVEKNDDFSIIKSHLRSMTNNHVHNSTLVDIISPRAPKYPYVVCQKEKLKLGYEFKTEVVSHFGENIMDVYNDKDKTCFIVHALPSMAKQAPESLLVQPLLTEMKIAAGTVEKIISKDDSDIHNKKSFHLSALLCPGASSRDVTIAEDIGRSIINFIRNSNDDKASTFATSKRSLRTESMSHDNKQHKTNINHDNIWKSAFDEGLDADHKCDEMFSKVLISGGYRGESFAVGQSDDANERSIPIDASPACLLSLIGGIAASRDVCFVEVVPELKLLNAESQWITQSGVEDKRPWFDAGLDGKGQVVAVSDSGVDIANCYFWDASRSVKTDGSVASNNRKVIQYVAYTNGSDDSLIGHGTHVSGTIAGRKAKDGKAESTGIADGMAREAKISMFDVGFGPLILPPRNFEDLFLPGQQADAFIHSASWGAMSDVYETNAREFDNWIYNNPNFLSIIAAGNSGASTEGFRPKYNIPNTIGTPATAKNIIAVGATESYGQELNEPRMKGYDHLAYFSSRGPTADGRSKPDVTAPGYNILSAKSQGRSQKYSCDNDDGTKFMAGTSMAAPAVSGTAALVRQYFIEGWYPSGKPVPEDAMIPSAALMKAVLMNGAQYLKGVNNQGRVTKVSPYDNAQGYGRISMIDSLYLADGSNDMTVYVQDNKSVGVFSKSNTFKAVVKTSSAQGGCTSDNISVTLVWTDPVSMPYCKKCLLNDIDLIVRKNNGKAMFPNGLDGKDDTNNAERVKIMDVVDGDEISVSVSVGNLVTSDQKYALVMTGCFDIIE